MWKRLAILTAVTVSASAQLSVLAGEISSAWSAVSSVLSAFKSSSKDTVLATLTNQGYQSFMDKTDVSVVQQIPDMYWPTFVNHMSTNLLIPPPKLDDFHNYLMDIQYVGNDDWSALQTTFNLQDGATCNYVMICTAHDRVNGTYTWVHANIQAQFTLMPNVFVIAHEQTNFFSDKVSIHFLEKPAGVTEKDFEPIFAFFKLIAFKEIGGYLNLNLPPLL